MTEQVLRDMAAYEAALQLPRVLLFKHSPVCPISSAARSEWRIFGVDHPDVPMLFVDVIGSRAVARGIADACGVKHESPQAILFEHGEAVWSASHEAITAGALEAAWAPRC